MTLNKILCMCAVIIMTACNSDEETLSIGNRGYQLVYTNRPPERVIAYHNHYHPNIVDTIVADLHVFVTSSLKENPTNLTPQEYTIEGNKKIEQQIEDFLNPNNSKYNGDCPVGVEYRTVPCKDIRITMYAKNGSLISDITDQARFYYVCVPHSCDEDAANLLINSDMVLLGKIKLGTTIKQYLSYNPMIFAEAHFIFDGISKDKFADGNYAVIEIYLGDGTILETRSL